MAPTQSPAKAGLAGTKPVASRGGARVVALRFEFYRDGFRWMVTIAAALALIVLGQTVAVVILAQKKPIERYFTVDAAGRVIPIKALNEPFVDPATLTTWVANRVMEAYRLDPKNYVAQTEALRPKFTPEGFDQYRASLSSSGTIDLMTKRLLVMSPTPIGAAVIVNQGVLDGVYHWRVRVPVLVDFQSSTAAAQKRRMVEVVVVRRHTIEADMGIGISQFVARDV